MVQLHHSHGSQVTDFVLNSVFMYVLNVGCLIGCVHSYQVCTGWVQLSGWCPRRLT